MGKNGNISTMQAKSEASGEDLNTNRILAIVGSYALMFGVFATLFTWNIIPGIILTTIMAIIGYYVLVPKEINARYFRYGLAQRHSFMSAVTQIFGEGNNANVTVETALRNSLVDLYGEFKQNVEGLISVIGENGNGHKTHVAFLRMYRKYAGDIWFTNFLEQLETTEDEGVVNADAFHDLMKNADALFDNQFKYRREKKHQKSLFFWTNVAILGSIFVIPCEGFGINNYINIYASTWVGWLISIIYIAYMILCYYLLYKYYYDESITSIK